MIYKRYIFTSTGEYKTVYSCVIRATDDKWLTARKSYLISNTKNLFDKSKITTGKALASASGAEYVDATCYASDYINVSGISTLTISPSYTYISVCFYDKDKNHISSARASVGVSVPSNAVYLRFDNKLTNLDSCQVEKGDTATKYAPYSRYL